MSALPPKANIRWPRISGLPGAANEIIWRPVAKLIHFDRCQVVSRFLKLREINGNSSKRIILNRKNPFEQHCANCVVSN
jgi:hypothetical protein